MRALLYILVIAAALLIPEEGTDVAEIIPAELIRVSCEGGNVVIETETGDKGTGATVREAAADLEQRATGVIFLDAVDYLLVTTDALALTDEAVTLLKQNVQVYEVEKGVDLQDAAAWLNAKK